MKEAFESAKSQLEEGINEETMEELLEKLKEAGLNEDDVAEFAEVAKAKAEELAELAQEKVAELASMVEDLDAEQLAEEAADLLKSLF